MSQDIGASLRPSDEVLEQLSAWGFNVMLECSGREDDKLEMAIGGAILDLRGLEKVLEWAHSTACAMEAKAA